jgi:hypothetical protein
MILMLMATREALSLCQAVRLVYGRKTSHPLPISNRSSYIISRKQQRREQGMMEEKGKKKKWKRKAVLGLQITSPTS